MAHGSSKALDRVAKVVSMIFVAPSVPFWVCLSSWVLISLPHLGGRPGFWSISSDGWLCYLYTGLWLLALPITFTFGYWRFFKIRRSEDVPLWHWILPGLAYTAILVLGLIWITDSTQYILKGILKFVMVAWMSVMFIGMFLSLFRGVSLQMMACSIMLLVPFFFWDFCWSPSEFVALGLGAVLAFGVNAAVFWSALRRRKHTIAQLLASTAIGILTFMVSGLAGSLFWDG